MKLYHFSEESGIGAFRPRVKANRTELPPVVWAIDEAHAFTFWVPRACPRIVYWRSEDMVAEDERRFFGATSAPAVMTVETGWLERIQTTALYRYELPADGFERFDEIAGYYISRMEKIPSSVTRMTGLLERLAASGIELRLTPSLHPLREALLGSSVTRFGIHQFGNASPPSP
ncbi:DUF6886 family protein [Paenibacillus sp. B01]|uniref:DUF6886 family protein n=1 Tax=Paenibacillus sp. B01 TaxID=2660554 RepID=UPI00129B10DF|nr:DUF6886 family protein [Paenibacillus sp. B01]QGG57921.1 hypothetical protein GE073_21685 [Paenibacillus sp. B01]